MSLHFWSHQGPHNPSNGATFMLNPQWGRVATGEKKKSGIYARGDHFSHVQLFATLWIVVYQACLSVGFSRQEYWSVLANTGCHTFPENYISCWPSHKLAWVPGATRASVTQAAISSPHMALTWADPGLPVQPQEQTPVDDPHAEMEIKPQLKPRGSVAKEEDPKPSHQLYELQIKSTWSSRQTLCLWNI